MNLFRRCRAKYDLFRRVYGLFGRGFRGFKGFRADHLLVTAVVEVDLGKLSPLKTDDGIRVT
jgi:hypothetical protein